MPSTGLDNFPSENDDRFAVGWQRLTRQEFLEAISAALLDRLPKHELDQSEKSALPPGPHTGLE